MRTGRGNLLVVVLQLAEEAERLQKPACSPHNMQIEQPWECGPGKDEHRWNHLFWWNHLFHRSLGSEPWNKLQLMWRDVVTGCGAGDVPCGLACPHVGTSRFFACRTVGTAVPPVCHRVSPVEGSREPLRMIQFGLYPYQETKPTQLP